MGSEKTRKDANTRPALLTETVEQPTEVVRETDIEEIATAEGGNDHIGFEEAFNDIMEDEVAPLFIEQGVSCEHYNVLSNFNNLSILAFICNRTGLRADACVTSGSKDYVCVAEVGNVLWASDEVRRQRRVKRFGGTTSYQDWRDAPDVDAKAEAKDRLKQEKQRYVMRVKRVVDAACQVGLMTRTPIRPNYVAVRAAPSLRGVMSKLVLLRAAGKR